MADNKFERDGIILLNKEKGMTSFAAVNKLKKIIKAGKAGHAGTLDPMAEGLLIVMINNVTKFSDDFMKKDKEYYVEFELGYETDTYDLEGEVTRRYEGEIDVPEERITEAINSFKGKIEQVPPMYSAIKVKGEKLYNLARKGIEIERKPRKVKIYSVREIKVEKDVFWKVSFYVEVGSGTYVRSLVRDIGEKLEVYATMTKLVRTKVDKFTLDESVSLEEVENEMGKSGRIPKFQSVEFLFNYDTIVVSEEKYKNLKNGMTVLISNRKVVNPASVQENKLYSIYVNDRVTQKREFKGIGRVVRKSFDKIYLKRDKYFV